MEHVITGNGNEISITERCATEMMDQGLLHRCDEDHPTDAIYYHTTDELDSVAF